MLCLCKIEESKCKPYDCYKFENYEKINQEQFLTEDYDNYLFLEFIKEGKTLYIKPVGYKKPIEPASYTKSEISEKTDPKGLIKELKITFNVKDIKSFNPFVDVKEPGLLLPAGIPNMEGFTQLFDINISHPPLYGQSIEDYIVNPRPIDINVVKSAYILISLPKNKYEILTEPQKQNINLYFKLGQEWKKSKMLCQEAENEVLCEANIEGFSQNFAISIEEQIEITTGECAGFAPGLILIQKDSKISCSDKVCCAHPEAVAQIEKTRSLIEKSDDYLVIFDAARTLESQRLAFLDYLSGGYEAAGPEGINKYSLAAEVTKAFKTEFGNIKTTKQQKIDFALKWLSENKPELLVIINDLSKYIKNSNHYNGRAIDIRLKAMPSDYSKASNDDVIRLRNLMCKLGWANYGGEWWHYEYKTSDYETAKKNNQCFWSKDKYADAAATVQPNYA